MKIIQAVAVTFFVTTVSFGAMADSDNHPKKDMSGKNTSMPMTSGAMPMGQGGMMKGGGMRMMDPEKMKQRQEMMKVHMKTMEQHQANIEALLRELVAIQKAG